MASANIERWPSELLVRMPFIYFCYPIAEAKLKDFCFHGSDSPSSPFFPETGQKSSMCEFPPGTRRREDFLFTRGEELGTKKSVQTNLVKNTLIFLLTFSPFTLAQIFANFLFALLSKCIKAACSGHFFGSSFCCEGFYTNIL